MSGDPEEARTAQDVVRDFRKQQIVEAARALIGRRGYANVTMGRIAQAAGISRSTLYAYFDNKEAVLQESFLLGQRELDGRVLPAETLRGDVSAQIARLIAATFAYFDEHKAFFQAVVTQAYLGVDANPEGPMAMGALGRSFRRQLAELLRQGVEAGRLRPHDVRESSLVLSLTVHGAIGVRVRDPVIRVPADEAAAVIVDYFLRGIAKDGG